MFFWTNTFNHKLLQGLISLLHTRTIMAPDLGVEKALLAIGGQIKHKNNVVKECISL